jgi:hypothetical protein
MPRPFAIAQGDKVEGHCEPFAPTVILTLTLNPDERKEPKRKGKNLTAQDRLRVAISLDSLSLDGRGTG